MMKLAMFLLASNWVRERKFEGVILIGGSTVSMSLVSLALCRDSRGLSLVVSLLTGLLSLLPSLAVGLLIVSL